MLRPALALTLLLALPLAGHEAPAPRPADPVAAERARNLVVFRDRYLWWKDLLFDEHAGSWLVIAGGELLPADTEGKPTPALTLDEAHLAAWRKFPKARHRFVWRIGEEGDLTQALGGTEWTCALGTSFLARAGDWYVGPGSVGVVVEGERKDIGTRGPDGRPYVTPQVSAPGAAKVEALQFGIATGFAGTATLDAKSARRLGLELWEIPGTVTIEGLLRRGACRRARLRISFPQIDFDQDLRVAVWL